MSLNSACALCFALPAPLVGAGFPLPRPLETYHDASTASLVQVLAHRAALEPFNAVATAIFVLAIVHTFLTAKFRHWAHRAEAKHAAGRPQSGADADGFALEEVSFKGQVLHFFGEVEAVFGIWAVVLGLAITYWFGWNAVLEYIGHHVNFTEPMFVVVIMALSSTRPVLRFAEACLRRVAALGGGGTGAWWLTLLIVAPLLGSFITEPAAMTIGALLLSRRLYSLRPSRRLAYGTLGLLFVNVSVGGTLTHFAAPPVLMVAGRWQWDTGFMFLHFGWKAIVGILVSTTVYYGTFRRELARLAPPGEARPVAPASPGRPVPAWITVVNLLFIVFTVAVAHYPPLFIGAFLFFLAFAQATAHHQQRLELRSPLLVGFFLAGLVIHGGLQSWWIEPVLQRLDALNLFVGATLLTAFNDNAAITYLASLVPDFSEPLKYAVVAGAVAGGGLTVIANAPNPAGQSLLARFFPDGVAPLALAVAALPATVIVAASFLLL